MTSDWGDSSAIGNQQVRLQLPWNNIFPNSDRNRVKTWFGCAQSCRTRSPCGEERVLDRTVLAKRDNIALRKVLDAFSANFARERVLKNLEDFYKGRQRLGTYKYMKIHNTKITNSLFNLIFLMTKSLEVLRGRETYVCYLNYWSFLDPSDSVGEWMFLYRQLQIFC